MMDLPVCAKESLFSSVWLGLEIMRCLKEFLLLTFDFSVSSLPVCGSALLPLHFLLLID